MNNPVIRFLDRHELPQVLPLVQKLNPGLDPGLLAQRLEEMTGTAYKCVAAFMGEKIIGICGLWESVRFYSGRQIEVDNVIVDEDYRSQQVGKKLMEWVYGYARETGCNTVELNTYVGNPRSHKFYYNEGFVILGFHMQKTL
jgi:GNAT superfamily N-acetyltransferase